MSETERDLMRDFDMLVHRYQRPGDDHLDDSQIIGLLHMKLLELSVESLEYEKAEYAMRVRD